MTQFTDKYNLQTIAKKYIKLFYDGKFDKAYVYLYYQISSLEPNEAESLRKILRFKLSGDTSPLLTGWSAAGG